MIDRQALLDGVDIVEVAQNLGLKINPHDHGRLIGLLCPMHNDEHFGSCKINRFNNSFYCYVCGRGGNAIDLVMAANHWDPNDGKKAREAMGILADMYGKREDEISKVGAKKYIRLPNQEQLHIIGLMKHPVFDVRYSPYDPDIQERIKKELSESIIEEDGTEYVGFVVENDPLRALAEEEPLVFKDLIKRKCGEAKDAYEKLMRYVLSPAPKDQSTESQRMINDLIKLVGQSTVIAGIKSMIGEIEDIRVEYL